MRILRNWREVLRRAWSVRLIAVAVLLTGVEVALPFLDGYVDLPPRLFAGLAGLAAAGAFAARLIAQKGLSND